MKKQTRTYREKSLKELEKEVGALREEIAKMKLNQKVAPAKDTNLLFKKRKQLAMILTVLGEKKETS